MAYILKGDRSGTVRFTPSLGTISAEGATFTNKVTSSQVESGGSINDHAANDPIKLSILYPFPTAKSTSMQHLR